MKIIGTSENGFIIHATKDEAANLAGYYSAYDTSCRDWKAGVVIDIGKIYREAKECVELASSVKSAISTLNKNSLSLLQKIAVLEEKP